MTGPEGGHTRAARVALAEMLLRHLGEAGAPLELVADADIEDYARHALLWLAGKLTEPGRSCAERRLAPRHPGPTAGSGSPEAGYRARVVYRPEALRNLRHG